MSSLKVGLLRDKCDVIYETRGRVFHHISKHREIYTSISKIQKMAIQELKNWTAGTFVFSVIIHL